MTEMYQVDEQTKWMEWRVKSAERKQINSVHSKQLYARLVERGGVNESL